MVERHYDSNGDANYTVIRIFRKRIDGSFQYPFVFAPNGTGVATMSTLTMNNTYNFKVAINAGRFYVSGNNNQKPMGLLIQNGVLIQQGTDSWHPLTIDSNGNLGYTDHITDGNELINNGIISAVNGWTPIIENYEEVTTDRYIVESNDQMQIIGQYGGMGDYAIVTCEGRTYDNSSGWTAAEARAICKQLGLKFAYALDGGGSTETVVGKKQLNAIYERTYGRIVPTYIVFNGTDQFAY